MVGELAKVQSAPSLLVGRSCGGVGARSAIASTSNGSSDSDVSRSTAVMYDDEEEALMNELLGYDGARTPREIPPLNDAHPATVINAAARVGADDDRAAEIGCLESVLVSRDDGEIGRTSSTMSADYERELEEKMQDCLTSEAAAELENSSSHAVLKRHHSAPSLTPTSSRKFLSMVTGLINRRRNGKVHLAEDQGKDVE
jgi:hypothetical protein